MRSWFFFRAETFAFPLAFGFVIALGVLNPPRLEASPPTPSQAWEEVEPAKVTLLGQTPPPPAHSVPPQNPGLSKPPIAPSSGVSGSRLEAAPSPSGVSGSRPEAAPSTPQEPKGSVSIDGLASGMTRDQVLLFKSLTELIIAPCCFVQPLSLHSSPVSDQIKIDLQRRILGGQGREAIIAAYVQRYGERVLAIPPHAEIVWIPIVGGVLALFFCFWIIFRWFGRRPAEAIAG